MVFWSLLFASLIATRIALVRRSWPLMAVAAALSLPFALVAHVPYLVSWLLPCPQVAAAVALRWRVGVTGWLTLLLAGLVVGLAGGPGVILVDRDLGQILFSGLLIGFIALAWKQPPWMQPRDRADA
jgi:hypothetical protein